MPVRDREAFELATDVASRGTREEDEQLGHGGLDSLQGCDQHVWALDSFGSRPSPQPTPSFWNEPTTNALAGTSSAVARLLA